MAASALGVNLAWVTRLRAIRAVSSSPGIVSSRGATTSVPPLASAVKTSSTEASKCSGAKRSTRDRGPFSYSREKVAMVLHTPPCSTSTPLGSPVEPEV